MTELNTYCDRCHKKMGEGYLRIQHTIRPCDFNFYERTYDICGDCLKEFEKWMLKDEHTKETRDTQRT